MVSLFCSSLHIDQRITHICFNHQSEHCVVERSVDGMEVCVVWYGLVWRAMVRWDVGWGGGEMGIL